MSSTRIPISRRPRLAALARRLGVRARPVLDLVPLTPLGLFTLAGATLALAYYGLKRIDLLLLVVGVVGLAIGALSLLGTVVATALLRVRLRRRDASPGLRLECGVPARTGFSVPRLRYIPLVTVEWSWEDPLAAVRKVPNGARFDEEVTPRRRVLGEQVVRRIEVGDVFGLCKMAFRLAETRPLRFLPSKGSLAQVRIIRSIAGGEDVYDPAGSPDGERVDTRAYAPGDPIRLVLWKVYARSRQLIVRTPERAFSVARKTIAYQVSGEGDEPAAGAARVAVESGALGSTWVLGADGNEHDATSAPAAMEVLARSASTPAAKQGEGLTPFLRRAAQGGSARAVVFVPARRGPWLDRVIAAVRAMPRVGAAGGSLGTPIEVVVATDGIDLGRPPSWLSRIAFARPALTGLEKTPSPELAAVVAALSAARVRVTVVDRRTGRMYADAQRKTFLAAPPGTKDPEGASPLELIAEPALARTAAAGAAPIAPTQGGAL